jgi:geranylgeranylglycerol-phosphate geranylgeranyltransferase
LQRQFAEFSGAGWALLRPFNCLITAVSVGVGALTSGLTFGLTFGLCADLRQVIVAATSAALITAAGNIHNDLRDIEVDRINRPQRPLPAGRISIRTAAIEATVLGLAGWLLSWWLGPQLFGLASGVAVGLYLYNTYLKSTVLWGNLMVSLLAAAAFPYGALAAGDIGRAWLPAAFAFLFHFGREIIKDLEDAAGDQQRGVTTLALGLGPSRASAVTCAVFVVLMIITLVPWAFEMYGYPYLITIGFLDILLLMVVLRMFRTGGRLTDQRLSRTLTVGMILGLLAIILGESL